MSWAALARFIFIQYCIVAGVLLAAAPWSLVWDRILIQAARNPWLMQSLDAPFGRAAITGFGLIHLLWGAHDLEVLILHRLGGEAGPSTDSAVGSVLAVEASPESVVENPRPPSRDGSA
ncbi:MAG: hypothetical protein AAGD01_11500 [Acidobacteriota bacterium]